MDIFHKHMTGRTGCGCADLTRPAQECGEEDKSQLQRKDRSIQFRMLYSRPMRLPFILVVFLICCCASLTCAQTPTQPTTVAIPDYSGMYSFVKEGEFIQITLEDKGNVSGFISRYGDSDNDKGAFLDQFIKSGTSNGKQVSFTTETVHGVTYRFEGAFDRGPGKKPQDEAYFVVRGTLTKNTGSPDGKNTTTQTRQVEFRSFPRDADSPQ